MKKKLLIVGASEIARIAVEYFKHDSDYEVVGLAIDEAFTKNPHVIDLPVYALENVQTHFPPDEYDAFVAIGSGQLNRIRVKKYDYMKSLGYRLASYVSSKAFVWHNVRVGENCFNLGGQHATTLCIHREQQ